MKTFLIDLDSLSPEVFRELLGFILTVGLNFRKIDLIRDNVTSRTLVVETATKAEEKGLSDFLDKREVEKPISILSNNKATVGIKVLGTFKQLGKNATAELYYQDKSTGKRFIITKWGFMTRLGFLVYLSLGLSLAILTQFLIGL